MQWNLSIEDTTGTQLAVLHAVEPLYRRYLYSSVSFSAQKSYLTGHYLDLEKGVTVSQCSLRAQWVTGEKETKEDSKLCDTLSEDTYTRTHTHTHTHTHTYTRTHARTHTHTHTQQ